LDLDIPDFTVASSDGIYGVPDILARTVDKPLLLLMSLGKEFQD